MFLTCRKWTLLYILTFLLLFVGFAAILWHRNAAQTVQTASSESQQMEEPLVLVIDPGHGGEDSGAQAADGTREAEINLAVGRQIYDLAGFLGVDAVLTRVDESSIHDPGTETVHERKVSDLKNRAAMANNIPGGVLVSIHQNSLPESKSVHGAQVFYNAVPESEGLAQGVQEALNQVINDRPKETKAAGSRIYLLRHTECPAILVECGFMSNNEEVEKLKSEAYQTRLGVTILSSTLCALNR